MSYAPTVIGLVVTLACAIGQVKCSVRITAQTAMMTRQIVSIVGNVCTAIAYSPTAAGAMP